ncbi:PREDICTED: uncharacterized protein LOC107328609 isoform X1 [Acropora digitifera]|uniref:uncharacterized protein LOC107328609 isoform X1 n=1 Tax=Acropora digitifera TaxID=70779 RepID=UPI00077AE6D8|nr:PREDICTED: uncharacterized protein LOC107328609 isoform X1 [Acropora digitifera]
MVKLFTSFFLFTGFLAVLLPEGNSLRCHSCYSAKSWDDCVKNSVIFDCSNMNLLAERKPSEVRCAEVFTSEQTKNGQQLDKFAKFCTTWERCDDERCREEITESGDKDVLKANYCDVECCSGDLCNGGNLNLLPLSFLVNSILLSLVIGLYSL